MWSRQPNDNGTKITPFIGMLPRILDGTIMSYLCSKKDKTVLSVLLFLSFETSADRYCGDLYIYRAFFRKILAVTKMSTVKYLVDDSGCSL